jgi:hypothetical protein
MQATLRAWQYEDKRKGTTQLYRAYLQPECLPAAILTAVHDNEFWMGVVGDGLVLRHESGRDMVSANRFGYKAVLLQQSGVWQRHMRYRMAGWGAGRKVHMCRLWCSAPAT